MLDVNGQPAEGSIGEDLRNYMRTLRRRKWWVIATVTALTALAVWYAKQETPIYRATARVVLGDRQTESLR